MDEAVLEFCLSNVIMDDQWSAEVLRRVLPEYWVNLIVQQPVPRCSGDVCRRWVWEGNYSDTPSTKDIYNQISQALTLFKECAQWKQDKLNFKVKDWVLQENFEDLLCNNPIERQREPILGEPVFIITDGSVNTITRAAGAAFVLIRLNGQVFGAGFAGWPWSSPSRMEAEGIRLGVQVARMKGLKNLVVCSDSLELVNLLLGLMVPPMALQQVVEAIRLLDSTEDKISFCKVSRRLVGPAEALAIYARKTQTHGLSNALIDKRIRRLLVPYLVNVKDIVAEVALWRAASSDVHQYHVQPMQIHWPENLPGHTIRHQQMVMKDSKWTALSSKLDAAVTHGAMGKFLKHDLNISHLCFADDLIIFTDAQASLPHSLKLLLEEFSMAPGLHLNPLKSQLFSSCSAIEQSQILCILVCQLPVKKLVVNNMPSVGRKSALQRSREA
ncbi:hypothetical protein QJS10_CPB11g01467 [Acorus calamus]|uniref:RNase H type-1 domain-containing protein n=1 Tax=Acorus calamus TaxID=4465 RepID=A0AAV9DSP9_ACOCL|nr:hypothetical protein QJS10_CPB11g01467 [Acorus calamus]